MSKCPNGKKVSMGSPCKNSKKNVNKLLRLSPSEDVVKIPSLGETQIPETVTEELQTIEVFQDEGLERELLAFGYIPISKILIKDTTGESHSQYVKAINKMGQKVY